MSVAYIERGGPDPEPDAPATWYSVLFACFTLVYLFAASAVLVGLWAALAVRVFRAAAGV